MRVSDKAAVERILKAMADPENLEILTHIRKTAKSGQSLSVETEIPLSTVYRKLDEMKEAGLIMTEHYVVRSGKKVEHVTTTFSELKTMVSDEGVIVDIVPNDETANIRWLDIFRSG